MDIKVCLTINQMVVLVASASIIGSENALIPSGTGFVLPMVMLKSSVSSVKHEIKFTGGPNRNSLLTRVKLL
jgi:hypothetical protein